MSALGEAADALNATIRRAEEWFLGRNLGASAELPLPAGQLMWRKSGQEWGFWVVNGDMQHRLCTTSIETRLLAAAIIPDLYQELERNAGKLAGEVHRADLDLMRWLHEIARR